MRLGLSLVLSDWKADIRSRTKQIATRLLADLTKEKRSKAEMTISGLLPRYLLWSWISECCVVGEKR